MLNTGDTVYHETLGYGTVEHASVTGSVTVKFGDGDRADTWRVGPGSLTRIQFKPGTRVQSSGRTGTVVAFFHQEGETAVHWDFVTGVKFPLTVELEAI